MNFFLAIVQSATLVALFVTVYVSYRQAKAAEKTVKLSRAELHAAFRPVVEVVNGEHRGSDAMLTLQNVGNSPALTLIVICRSGYRLNLGTLAVDNRKNFRFDYKFNVAPQPVGPPENREQFKVEIQPVPLRLEYTSVSGANCWTNVDFPLRGLGEVESEHKHGTDLP